MSKPFNICVLASGGGGNFQALVDQSEDHGYSLVKLITDRDCGAINRAEAAGIATTLLDRKVLGAAFFEHLEAEIPAHIDLVVLAGFMPIIPAWLCSKWRRRIINTHPSLLPDYGGRGMYGIRVQEAVLGNGERFAGCTVHFVTDVVDGGDIILQSRIEIEPQESAWALGGRVFLEENKLLPLAVVQLMAEARRQAVDEDWPSSCL